MRWRKTLSQVVLLTVILSAHATAVRAQGWIEPLPGRRDPGVVKERTSVVVRVTDRVATVEVEEWFRNNGGGLGEGDYIYPLPGEAVFSNFSLLQGDEALRGETMDAERARAIYEDIVRRRKDPALIELVGHGMVRARVFPIQPGESRRITMRYTQILERAGDAVQFRYAAAGRFGGILPAGTERGQGAQRVREDAPLTFTLVAEQGNLFRGAFSPTHEVRVTRDGRRMTVCPVSSLQGDFALFLPLAERAVGITVATHRPVSSEDGYFMLTLSPADVGENLRVARDLTAVVDVSGSMSGEKIEQAKAALRQLVQSLGREDRFRLVRFSSGVSSWRDGWTRATPAEIRSALEWIDGLRAEGGTNISGALTEAFDATSPDSRLPVIVFMTDGLPSAGEQNPERIAQMAEQSIGRARIFAFGVGYDVNTYLLDRLGNAGRGRAQYVEPGENVEEAVATLATRIRHPVLADLEIADAPVEFEEVYPRQLPDLFAGEDLVIFGRYRVRSGNAAGQVAITGRRNDRTERYATRATFPAHENANDFIPRLWASRKIGVLQQEVRLNGRNPELIEEIRATALHYGLLSEYTSYLVQEPELMARRDAATAAMAASASPMAQSGKSSVERAEQARSQREVRNLAQMTVMEARAAARDEEARDAATRRTVAGRTFVQLRGVWTDMQHRDGAGTVRVRPFSDAYFALLRALPELEPYWKQFDRVIVAGRAVAIELAPDGQTRWSPAELHRVVSEFRAK